MRRPTAIIVLLVAVAAVVLLTRGGTPMYTVDARFDTADGMVSGQNVEIAGTKVGTVQAVRLVRSAGDGYQAVMVLSVPRRFAPFRADASCRILPEGIISENYVDCDPGTSPTALPAGSGGVPEVPLDHTSAPLSLQSVLDTFAAPAPERLRILIDELGIGTAGEGENVNAILQRADPALVRASDVLGIINSQRDQVAAAVSQTNQVLAELATRGDAVRAFVDRAATVAKTTAIHRAALEQAVERLPPLLGALDGALAPVRQATSAATPVIDRLAVAAPALGRLNTTLPAFSAAGLPAVEAVGRTASSGLSAIGPVTPVAAHLRALSTLAEPTASTLDKLLIAFRNSGGSEATDYFFYKMSLAEASYDTTSHFTVALPQVYATCILENLTAYTRDSPGCSHAYSAPDDGRIPPNNIPPPGGSSASGARAQLKSFLGYLLEK